MSEHRRKPPQPSGGGRAAARRGAQPPPSGRRAAPPRGAGSGSHAPAGEDDTAQFAGRAEARRAARSGSGRRRAAAASTVSAASRPNRLIDYPRHDKYGWRRWTPSWKQVTGVTLTGMLFLLGGSAVAYALVEEPDPNKAATQQNNVYYWSDGTRMATAGSDTNRQKIKLEDMPLHLQNAVIAAENDTFRTDRGVSVKGIARAAFNMATGGETQGGSTITQQYVKNMFLSQDQTLTRKAKELFISLKLGDPEDKDEVLEGYLNTSWFGRNAYGIQAAAQAYYQKDAADLNVSESAFLAALLKGEGTLNPDYGPKQEKNARERWSWILDREVQVGLMEAGERAKYTADDFPMPDEPKQSGGLSGQRGYMVELVNNYLMSSKGMNLDRKELGLGGYQIHTTFDKKKVDLLAKTVKKTLAESLDPKRREEDRYIQVGGASVVPGDGAIVAIYGGEDYLKHYTSNADYTGVTVGSTFKPFVLAAALDVGVRDPGAPPDQPDSMRTKASLKSVYNGDNKVRLLDYNRSIWQNEKGEQWRQVNDQGEDYGPIDLREAMRISANTPYIQLGMDVGVDKVREAALKAGINKESLAPLSPTFSLGTSAPSAIRLADAYATFAASGQKAEPYSVTKVLHNGEKVYTHPGKTERAFPNAVADNVTDALRTVVEKGTGSVAKEANLGRPAAGKTGTTDDNKSAWFAGYTPQLSTAIGMWRYDSSAGQNAKYLSMNGVAGLDSVHGASFPAQIWTEYMKRALAGEPIRQFPRPEPIGEIVYGQDASPTPTATPTKEEPSEAPSSTPTEEESETPTEAPSSTPTEEETCGVFGCPDDGGADEGSTDGSTTDGSTTDGSTTDGSTTDGSTTDGGNNGNNGNNDNSGGGGDEGGIFG